MVLAPLLIAACASSPPSSEPEVEPVAMPAMMARDQLLFVGQDPDPVTLLAVLQRVQEPDKAVVEVKGFIASGGRVRSPLWERVELERWPGQSVESALVAWREHRKGGPLRVEWTDDGSDVEMSFRTPEGGAQISAVELYDAGAGKDPHGVVLWRAGSAELTMGDRLVPGLLVVESLDSGEPRPWFGNFEMWLWRPSTGGLILGRTTLGEGVSEALMVTAGDLPKVVSFEVGVLERGGLGGLPTAWTLSAGASPVEAVEVVRAGGKTSKGLSPDDGPAYYDVAAIQEREGAGAGLLLHLKDRDD